MNNAAELTIERIVDELSALLDDKRFINDILEATESDDSKSVVQAIRRVIGTVENEFGI